MIDEIFLQDGDIIVMPVPVSNIGDRTKKMNDANKVRNFIKDKFPDTVKLLLYPIINGQCIVNNVIVFHVKDNIKTT